jgi:DNA-binding response OmpR family regulator
MPTSNDHELSEFGATDDLRGLEILLVEDSPVVADALKQHLELLGARVIGPAATTAEAKKLIAQSLPHVALIDFHLRGENSCQLIAQARDLGIPVIMLSGSLEFPVPISLEGIALLEKPASEAQILEYLRPIVEKRRGQHWPKQ